MEKYRPILCPTQVLSISFVPMVLIESLKGSLMSSKRNLKKRSHDGKVQYKSESEAYFNSRRIGKQLGELLRYYLCNYCPYWHIGHPAKGRRNA